jgi:hypothetical protein
MASVVFYVRLSYLMRRALLAWHIYNAEKGKQEQDDVKCGSIGNI